MSGAKLPDFLRFFPGSDATEKALPVFVTVKKEPGDLLIGLKYQTADQSDVQFQVFSGRNYGQKTQANEDVKDKGRIPAGTYYVSRYHKIGNRPGTMLDTLMQKHRFLTSHEEAKKSRYWFSLYRMDGVIDDITISRGGTRREGIRAHYGRVSLGCLTFSDRKEYKKFIEILASAPEENIVKSGKKVEKSAPGSFRVFGKIVVE